MNNENKPKHTPGPWEIRIGQESKNSPFCDGRIEIATESNTLICAIEDETAVDWTAEEMLANAALIAAAPELLEAGKSALEYLVAQGLVGGDIVDDLRAAIAKAEGKS